jgi:hypothetical protein
MLIANAVLSHASDARGDRKTAEFHAHEVARLAGSGASAWTREIVEALQRKKRRGRRRGQP